MHIYQKRFIQHYIQRKGKMILWEYGNMNVIGVRHDENVEYIG